ncbi:MAG: carboxypeptidase-like regulatory domain-containing protein [Bacteroidales bacterium]|nr:carboxypeptidase-like regulatory domain-containing protein [Bacteroidales bacterium]
MAGILYSDVVVFNKILTENKMIKKLKSSFCINLRFSLPLMISMLFLNGNISHAGMYYNDEFTQIIQKEAGGIVTDEDGMPLKGVIIIVSKSLIHVTSDKDGRFSISNIPEGASVTFMLRGYKTYILPPLIVSNTSLKIKMLKDPGYKETADTTLSSGKK